MTFALAATDFSTRRAFQIIPSSFSIAQGADALEIRVICGRRGVAF